MTHHPHVHMIVPGGGLSADGGRWIACRPEFFLPVRVLSRLFRRLVLGLLFEAHGEGRLKFSGAHATLACRQAFATFLAPLKRSEWVVYAKKPFAGPEAVLAYLSRYTHRVAISNRRLVAADESGVTGSREDHDARPRRIYPALSHARAAEGLPPHPPLRPPGQWQPRGQPCQGPRTARRLAGDGGRSR
jgi:hypothetical protein